MSDDPLASILGEIRQLRTDLLGRTDQDRADLLGRMDQDRADLLERMDQDRADLLGRIDRLRTDLMARMDRLQDSLSEQRDDISVLLDLLVTHQRIAERALSEARSSLDGLSSSNAAIATLERQVRRLQDDVRQLKNGQPRV